MSTEVDLANKIETHLDSETAATLVLEEADFRLMVQALRGMDTAETHAWQMKPTSIPAKMFAKPMFCADALKKMVARCVSLHAGGSSLYTDGERKVMLAAAEHLESLYSASAVSNGDRA